MNDYQEGYKVVKEFAEAGAKGKTVSSWFKKKIPVELRREWYEDTVGSAIQEYNLRCMKWLEENVK